MHSGDITLSDVAIVKDGAGLLAMLANAAARADRQRDRQRQWSPQQLPLAFLAITGKARDGLLRGLFQRSHYLVHAGIGRRDFRQR